jgi:DNA-binding NarL/FixJ family response regulator
MRTPPQTVPLAAGTPRVAPPGLPLPPRLARITVALVEENRLVREGISTILNRFPDIRVLDSAPPQPSGVPDRTDPDVVLLDLPPGLDNGDGRALAEKVRTDFPQAGLILMDVPSAGDDLVGFIGVGVSGFLMSDASPDEVAETIRAVASGYHVLPDAITGALFSEITRGAVGLNAPPTLDGAQLTTREQEVIDLIAEGMSNKAIGRALHISIHTVKSHLRNIMEKLTLHSRLQLARYVHDERGADPEKEG